MFAEGRKVATAEKPMVSRLPVDCLGSTATSSPRSKPNKRAERKEPVRTNKIA